MATSPTVLAGSATSAPVPAPIAAPASFPLAPLVIAVIVGTLVASLGFGGIGYYLLSSGRLLSAGSTALKTVAIGPLTTHAIVLEPVLVNLADAGGNSYLRLALTLRVADAIDKKNGRSKEDGAKDDKGSNEVVAALRDTTLSVLGGQTAEDLLAKDGKEHLKARLKSAFAEHNTDLKVTDVFFTDFLVQR
jgi:flagellar protein FliL